MGRLRGLEFRVYVEGILLPCQPRAVSVQMSSGQPPEINVSLPSFAFSALQKIKPRTHVSVFYRETDNPIASDESWVLLSEGEVRGYRMGKSAAGAHYADLALQTLDAYWAQTYAMQFTSTQMLFSTEGQSGVLLFGTKGNLTRTISLDQRAPIPLETEIKAMLGKPDLQFPEVFAEVLNYTRNVNDFFRLADSRLRIADRLRFVPDAEVKRLVEAKGVAQLMEQIWSEAPQDGRLASILAQMMSNVHYAFQSSALPSADQTSAGPAIRQFFLIPDLPFIAPPRCNAIFSGECSDWTFTRDTLVEPTRARFTHAPYGQTAIVESYYAPPQMADLADRILAKKEAGKTIDSLILSGSGVPESSREDVKGVIPYVDTFHAYDLIASGESDPGPRRRYLSSMAEYELFLEQHRQRKLYVSMPFMPSLMCGFNGLFMDPSLTLFGRVEQVSHELVAEGAPMTRVAMSHCHTEEPDGVTPVWMNQNYMDPQRLDKTYEALLGAGHSSVMAPMRERGVGQRFRSGPEAAARLMQLYEGADSKETYAAGYSHRRIANLSQLMSYLKARRAGADFTGGAFRGEWQDAARAVAAQLKALTQDVT